MEITQIPNISADEMANEIMNGIDSDRFEVAELLPSVNHIPFVRVFLMDGMGRDSTFININIRDNNRGGVFLITMQYFSEAEEGHGSRFNYIRDTLEIIDM